MNPDEIIVVTGIPRSGTTCMVRMLEAGGIESYYDQTQPIEFENGGRTVLNYNRILRESEQLKKIKNSDWSWLGECKGKVVKILTPAKVDIPRKYHYRFIWMNRKPMHCARSNRKFVLRNSDGKIHHKSLVSQVEITDLDVLMDYIKDQKEKGLHLLGSYPNAKLMIVHFEELIKKPRLISVRVANFLEREMDIGAMAEVVIARPAHCLPKMLEEEIYTAIA